MVPEETEETTDCLPKPQSKSAITQLDVPVMVAPNEDVNSRIPEISQSLAEAASTELPLNVNNDVDDTIIDQVILEEFAFPFPVTTYTLDIQGSNSDQVTDSPPSSSVLIRNITTAAEYSSVNHSNVLHGGSTTNGSAGTSLPNNPMGQNPQIHLPWISDPYEYELEKLRREEENLRKNFEEKTSELMADLERKMAEARSEFERESQELDAAYIAKAMQEEANRSLVHMSSLLANAFMCKCTDPQVGTCKGTNSGHSIQQQQAVQTNTHVNSTAPPRPSATAADPLLHFPHHNRTQPRPISQQEVAQTSAHMISTSPPPPSVSVVQAPTQPRQISQQLNSVAPPPPPVTAVEAQVATPSGPLLHSPRYTTTEPRPVSQEAVAQTNMHMNSTAPPRPSFTAAAESQIPNPPGPLLHSPRHTTTQPIPISQQMNSTALPWPSFTAAAEARIADPSGPLLHSPRYTITEQRPISQEAVAQTNTHMNSTAPPRPSVASAEAQIPRPSGPLLHSPRYTTPQPRPISQQMNSTVLPRPTVTAVLETQIADLSGPLLHSPRYTTAEPRSISQEAVTKPNTHMNSTAPPRPSVTAAETQIRNLSGPVLHSPCYTTTEPRLLSQEAVPQDRHMNSTAPPRPSVAAAAAETQIRNPSGPLLHSPRYDTTQPRPVSQRCNTPQPRPPPVISNHTPSSYAAVSFPPVHGTVRAPAPHLKRFRGPGAPSPAADASRRLARRQQQQQGNSNSDLVCLSDDDE